MRKFFATFCVLALIAPAGAALAATGDITATANVLQPLSVTNNLQDLDFGDVFPGVPVSVAFTDATAGKWQISGVPGAEVDISLTLPGTLVGAGSTMPISFGNGDAGWNAADNAATAAPFDPNAGTTQTLEAAAGDGFVWIGGTVTPASTQAAGIYTATITLSVVYTGN